MTVRLSALYRFPEAFGRQPGVGAKDFSPLPRQMFSKTDIVTIAGHGFYFVTPERWQDAVAGALTSHLGGHGPLLLTAFEGLSLETRRYLERVRPIFPDGDPTQARLNRGYLIASPEVVSLDQQAEIDWLLESMSQTHERMPGMGEQGH